MFNCGTYIYKDFKNNKFYGALIRLLDFFCFEVCGFSTNPKNETILSTRENTYFKEQFGSETA